ncbi:hypothetical protein J2S78_000317 [Salibacterium salarium]|uniref:hypothetical protein n=1 Tax=Salibacterium salarium TaxID=284579 RepID=UPI002781254D|nr:hypothetical protein [Salibacterium salarium]MDQ0297909.1 hypothetical protein [Salibacterium salarium]
MTQSYYFYQKVLFFALVGIILLFLSQPGEITAAEQDVGEEEETDIINVVPLSEDGRLLEVTFNSPVQALDRFQVKIFNEKSNQRHGVQEVEMQDSGNKAILTLYRSAELERLEDYVMKMTIDQEETTYSIHRTQFIEEGKITSLDAEDIRERRITIEEEEEGDKTINVPETIDVDLISIFNKEMMVEFNGEDEMVAYETMSEEEKVKRKNAFVGQYDLDDRIFIHSIDNGIASGMNQEVVLEEFVLVKDHERIQPEDVQAGDMLFFNDEEEVAEVYNDTVEGEVERVFKRSIDVNGENYEYDGYFVDSKGDVEAFDQDIAENLKGDVTLYFDTDNNIEVVSFR